MNTIQRIVRRLAMEMRHLLEGPSLQPALAGVPYAIRPEDPQGAPLKDFLEDMRDGILLAVPKHRRSLQRRMSRRIGMPQFEAKPRRDLKCCVECGHTYEAHTLCGHCYSKVRVESQAIQKAMEDSFGWNPIEQEVVVKYAGEDIKPEDKSKRIIERPTERPKFFSDNLLEKGHHKE